MAEFPALPIWTDALLGDTGHLTPAEFGAYMRLLIVAWRRPGCDLPNDDDFLGRSVGDPKGWKRRLKHKVLPFFSIGSDNILRQKKLTNVRLYTLNLKSRASAGGRATALKYKKVVGAKPPAKKALNDRQKGASISKKETIRDSSDRGVGAKIAKTGTRWPADATVPEVWIEEGAGTRAKHRLPMIDLRVEAVAFANYWSAKTGKDATKHDWRKTWINWSLKAEGSRNVRGNGKPPSAHDNFFAGVADAIRDTLEPEEAGDDHALAGSPRNPLLPP